MTNLNFYAIISIEIKSRAKKERGYKMKIKDLFIEEVEKENFDIWERLLLHTLTNESTEIKKEKDTFVFNVRNIEIRVDLKTKSCFLGNSYLNYGIDNHGMHIIHFILYGLPSRIEKL